MNRKIEQIPEETMKALIAVWLAGKHSRIAELHRAGGDSVAGLSSPRSDCRIRGRFRRGANRRLSISGLAEMERDHIIRALEASNWVIGGRNGAAERLGIKRTSLLYRMQKLGIDRTSTHSAKRFRKRAGRSDSASPS